MADARHAVVVVLVDPKMVIEKAAWNPYITALWAEAEKAPERHRVFPVAFAASAFNLMAESNFIRRSALAAAEAGEKSSQGLQSALKNQKTG